MPTASPSSFQGSAATGGAAAGAHSTVSERTVLASALRPDRAHLLPGLMGVLAAADFYVEAHGNLWTCLRTLVDTGKAHDPAAVLDYAAGKQINVGGPEYVVALLDDPTISYASEEAVKDCVRRVKDFSVTRLLDETLRRGRDLCTTGAEPPGSIIARVKDDLINLETIGESSRRGPRKLIAVLDNVLENVERAQSGEVAFALPTTYSALDSLIDGFVDEDLIILAGRPSMGKTSALLGLAERRARAHNRPQLIFSAESKDTSLGVRTLSSKASVGSSDIRNGRLDSAQMDRISEAMHQLGDLPIWMDDTPGLTVHEIRARARAFVAQHGKCDIYVDYLQKVASAGEQGGRTGERREQVAEVSNAFKNLARELKVPVIALSQLSRNLESRTNKRPMMSDLRESGEIEQDADIIIFLYRDEVYNKDTKTPGVAEWIVAKNREGAVGTAMLGWSAQTTTFYDLVV